MNPATIKAVRAMLKEFNSYFSYLHGKSDIVNPEMMPDAAIAVWARVYEEMSPDDRERAKAAVYERHSFHPTPEQFRQLVTGGEDGQALMEWINILDALRMSADDAQVKIKLLSPQARKALRVVGGLRGLGMCSEASLHKSVKEDFCRAWTAIKKSQPHELEEIDNTAPTIDKTVDVSQAISQLSANFAIPTASHGNFTVTGGDHVK